MESFFSRAAAAVRAERDEQQVSASSASGAASHASAAKKPKKRKHAKKKRHRRRRVVTTAYKIVDKQRRLLCGMHAIHNLLQKRVFVYNYSRRDVVTFIDRATPVVNAAYILFSDEAMRTRCRSLELQGTHDVKCCKCQIPVARPRCLGCTKTELDSDSVKETHAAALKAAEAAAEQAVAGQAVTKQTIRAVVAQVAQAAADRALHEVVRNAKVFSSTAQPEEEEDDSSEEEGEEDESSEEEEEEGSEEGSEEGGCAGDFLAACQDAAAPPPMAHGANGNFSSDAIDRLLNCIGVRNCRRSIQRPRRPFNVRQLTPEVLEAYEAGGFLGLIAFQGSIQHYVAFRFYAASAESGEYVYMDSLDRETETKRDFMNLGIYSRTEVFRWLKHNCYELQDGRRQMAYAWVVSRDALPTADAVPSAATTRMTQARRPGGKKEGKKEGGGGGEGEGEGPGKKSKQGGGGKARTSTMRQFRGHEAQYQELSDFDAMLRRELGWDE